jgi:predicted TIM-barrel fold metal-dependent hydrolase
VLTADQPLISVDDHLVEHPRVWLDRLPAAMRDAGPRVVEADGRQEWVMEARVISPSGLNAVAGTEPETRDASPARYDDMRPGCYDPIARVADMDVDGVAMQVNFPSVPGFAGRRFLEANDKRLAAACVEAYNDFVIDEWCGAAPDRLVPMTILPLWDQQLAVSELERCVDRGTKAVAFPDLPHSVGLPSLHGDGWDGVFAVAASAGVPLCCHFGSSGVAKVAAPDAPFAAYTAGNQITLMHSLSSFLLSPVFLNHPALKVVFSEASIGWWPYAAQRLDQVWEQYRPYPMEQGKFDTSTPPSQRMRSNVFGCFIDDPVGVALRHEIGIDNIMWESDYPHGDSFWPKSREKIAGQLESVPTEEVRKIVETNARRVFNLASAS